jgi:CrcB protein
VLQNPNVRAAIAVALGAIGGSLCRYYLGGWLIAWLPIDFPMGTLLVNLSGCFLMGFFTTLAVQFSLKPEHFLFLTTGFLGSYTTFSTYALEAGELFEAGHWGAAISYWLGSPLLGLLGLVLGMGCAHFLVPHAH